jgi:cyclophilin family peptidyl-prolyl cis-trans isomerase/HEAT repeat protein
LTGLLLLFGACQPAQRGSGSDAGATSSAAAGASSGSEAGASGHPAGGGRALALHRAELSRRAEQVRSSDLSSRDPAVRRSAARALARVRGNAVRPGLLRALGDEDPEVVAWAAYGLGETCVGQREPTASVLLSASVRFVGDSAPGDAVLSPMRAIARAIGACAAPQSERTLVRWAQQGGGYAVDAIYGLGDIATQKKRLREETWVTLLRLAAGDATSKPLVEALYPLGRVEHLPPSVVERAREVATARLAEPGPARHFAVRALGRTDRHATDKLQELLLASSGFTVTERAEAARALNRLGRPGQKALRAVLAKLVGKGDAANPKRLAGANVGASMALLESLHDVRKAQATVRKLAQLPAPEGAPLPERRRVSWLRCGAARVLVGRRYDDPLLQGCDLTAKGGEDAPLAERLGAIGGRAVVDALGLDGAKIKGRRLKVWRELATTGSPRMRQTAIEQLVAHIEIRDAQELLAKALGDDASGVAAAAAQVIAKQPERALQASKGKRSKDKGRAIHTGVRDGLLAGLAPDGDVEALTEMIDAAAAVGLGEALPKLGVLCASPYITVRKHAEKALAALSPAGKAKSCPPPPQGMALPSELEKLRAAPTTVVLDTDAGEMTLELDPSLAPVAVTRVAALAAAGKYDGIVVHRVVPGFVAQFGSPTADGYGAIDAMPSLACETSPVSYGPLSVGVALAGRDTGSTQIFVTHAPYPRLDGRYAWLGRAEGAWDALVDGDVIRKATVR